MKDIKKIVAGACVIAACLYSQDSAAQAIRASDGLVQGPISMNADMKSYEIISKEHGKEYSDYYKTVRERIVERLKRNYSGYYSAGEVELLFVLNSNGSLNRIDVDTGRSVNDRRLINIALSSIQQASPFPRFPKELDVPRLPFSLTITFDDK